jgi:hypothetical protein
LIRVIAAHSLFSILTKSRMLSFSPAYRIIQANTQINDDDSLKRSLKVFELLEAQRRKGSIKPDERVFTSFIRALTKGQAKGVHKKSSLLLQRMSELYKTGNTHIKPTTFTYNAVLNACAESLLMPVEDAPRLEAFKIALGVFNEMRQEREEPDHVTYGNMLKCAGLLPDGEKRDAVISSTFSLCCENGFVNSYVIRDLQFVASEKLWRSLVHCPEGEVDMDCLTKTWTLKFERRKQKPTRGSR